MTDKNQHIPQGYKDSPLGIIPEDWEVKRLGEACDYVDYRGKSPNKSANGIFLVTAKNIRNGYIDYEISKEFIPYDDFEVTMRRGKAQIGDVLITTEAPLGHIAQIDNPSIALAQRVIKYRGKRGLSNTYLKYYLMSDSFQTILAANATGSTALGIKGSRLHQLPIVIPSITEQDNIIFVLSFWDTAISKQTTLIEKLILRKRGLMQQLLTGKKRLKGFEGGDFHRLGHYITECNRKNNGCNRILSVTNTRGFILQEEQFEKIVASNDTSNYKLVLRGEFAYNPSRVNVGSLALLSGYDAGILSPMYIVFSANENIDKAYLLQCLQSWWFRGHIPTFTQGSVRDSLSFDGLCSMKFYIPSIEEQKAISSILVQADQEIEIQKQKLSSLQEQKKGLMQVLLTGKRRVK